MTNYLWRVGILAILSGPVNAEKLQLELGLAEARKQGLERVLITCDEDNEASRRTILSAGGVYENTIDRSQHYWIDLEDEDEQSQTSRMEK